MSDASDLAAWIELSLVSGLGSQRFRSLLSAFGLPTNVLNATRSQLCRVVPEALAESILERNKGSEVERALQWAARQHHRVLTIADTGYPKQLLEIPDPPPLLYVAGNARLLSSPALAVVGSRNATPQGLKNAQSFARAFSEAGIVIVSGLAIGVDSAAHSGGLEGRGPPSRFWGRASTSYIRVATSHSRSKSRCGARLCPNSRSAHRPAREIFPGAIASSRVLPAVVWSSRLP